MKGGDFIDDIKQYIETQYTNIVTKTKNFILSDEVKAYIKLMDNFKYPTEVMSQIKAENPAYTKVAKSQVWRETFGRRIKKDAKTFKIKTAPNQEIWVFDESQTQGRNMPSIYKNIKGEVNHYDDIFSALERFSLQPVVFEDSSYYGGVSKDFTIRDNRIVIRSNISQVQRIFAIIRALISINNSNDIVVEIASYIVCSFLGIDTTPFTIGYVAELSDFLVKSILDEEIRKQTIAEATTIVGYLAANLPHLQQQTQEEPIITTKKHSETVGGITINYIDISHKVKYLEPDPNLTILDLKEYGYLDLEMKPLGHETVTKLFNQGYEVYRLFESNEEIKINEIQEIDNHVGFFGIQNQVWEEAKINMVDIAINKAIRDYTTWEELKTTTEENLMEKIEKTQTELISQDKISKDGSFFTEQTDINLTEVYNETWLETHLPIFMKTTNKTLKEMPFFTDLNNSNIKSDRAAYKKINSLISDKCFKDIEKILGDNKKIIKTKDGKKNISYNILATVKKIDTYYNKDHVKQALEENYNLIAAPFNVKQALVNCFVSYVNKNADKSKKESHKDRVARLSKGSKEETLIYEGPNRNDEIQNLLMKYINKDVKKDKHKIGEF